MGWSLQQTRFRKRLHGTNVQSLLPLTLQALPLQHSEKLSNIYRQKWYTGVLMISGAKAHIYKKTHLNRKTQRARQFGRPGQMSECLHTPSVFFSGTKAIAKLGRDLRPSRT